MLSVVRYSFKFLIALLLIPFLFLTAEANTNEILVGMSAAFKGPTGGLGTELYRGSMAYINFINDNGGVNGRKIIIIPYDDGYNPTPAIENTIKLIEKGNVFLFGTPTVTRVLPLLKSYSKKNIYLFFPFTGAEPQRQPPYDQYVFNLRASYFEETEGLVNNFVKIGRKRIAVFYQADAYGRSGWNGVKLTLAKYGLDIVGEATYKRGTQFNESMVRQVNILRKSNPDAIISVGAYAACAAFIRDVRDSGWDVPIANVSFVGSEFLVDLLLKIEKETGRNYTKNLINSQVVPSYEDITLRAVRQYRDMIDAYDPMPPEHLTDKNYKPLRYSFVSFEGFLNAKLLVEILKRMGKQIEKSKIKNVVEGIKELDIGIDEKINFSPSKHQGLNKVYYTTFDDGRFVPLINWDRWKIK